ncbi:MAG: ABC transporter permease subunit [Rhodobacteraceae bacterium]|nr:ABC transporter permease subunit [Paracoccaceae bacterium]
MKSNILFGRIALGVYFIIFFGYLIGPLVVMGFTAFNSAAFPSITPWQCFTYEWFGELLKDERILNGIKNSFIVGIGTVILSVSIGLAASLVLTQVWAKWRSTFYTIIIAPILIPGVVLGISTLVFWRQVSDMFGGVALLNNGIFLTIIGQSTFIASYCMLVFVARLQRFDTGLTEAALDLGATHTQAFRKVLLPFMRPAIASAAVLAFLASFENYNTTTFTFGSYPTLTIELSQMVRYGINPSISALAVIIVVITVFGALALEVYGRRKKVKAGEIKKSKSLPGWMFGNIATILLVALSFAVIAMVFTSQSYSPQQCKADYREARDIETRLKIEALQAARAAANAANGDTTEEAGTDAPAEQGGASGAFGGVFAPTNLEDAAGQSDGEDSGAAAPASPFGGVFAPTNLEGSAGQSSGEATPSAPATAFGGVFDPTNLEESSGTSGN